LVILSIEQTPPITGENSTPIMKVLQLLNGIILYVVDNINIKLDISRHAWEVSASLHDV
jgi:hypothetical protein